MSPVLIATAVHLLVMITVKIVPVVALLTAATSHGMSWTSRYTCEYIYKLTQIFA